MSCPKAKRSYEGLKPEGLLKPRTTEAQQTEALQWVEEAKSAAHSELLLGREVSAASPLAQAEGVLQRRQCSEGGEVSSSQ